MTHRILVVNCGSSSLKFAYLDGTTFLAEGLFERLHSGEASAKWKVRGMAGERMTPEATHGTALGEVVALLEQEFGRPLAIDAIGHRVVHGGEFFREPALITDDVVEKIERCSGLAPLHNPASVTGIRVAREKFPNVTHFVVFDTAFHQAMPRRAWMYAVPYELYERHSLRRYGMHGTSHEFVARKAATALGKEMDRAQLITAHLGNGCSVCAIRDGRSVDTTMGLTPLEGVMMGTRSGDIDPNVQPYLQRVAGMSAEETIDMLNRRSGLLGVSGVSNDMRMVMAAARDGNDRAEAAVELFCYRLAKGILAVSAGLDRVDAVVFTGGIGENSSAVRARTIESLKVLGIAIDPDRNAAHGAGSGGRISTDASRASSLVIATSEELAIAQCAERFLNPV